MTNTVNAPNGFQPVSSLAGGPFIMSTRSFTIASGYSTAIFVGAPVKITTDGTIVATTTPATDAILGIFQGCTYFVNGTQNTTPGGYWPASQTYDTATGCVAKVLVDANVIYSVQYAGTPTLTMTGSNVTYSAESGNTSTGQSGIAVSGAATTQALPFKIIGLDSNPINAWGTAYSNVLVVLNQSQIANNTVGVA